MNKNIATLMHIANKYVSDEKFSEAVIVYNEIISKYPELLPIVNGKLFLIKKKTNKEYNKIVSQNTEGQAQEELANQMIESGLWDEKWYITEYYKKTPVLQKYKSTIDFYIKEGWKLGHRPSEFFEIYGSKFPKNLDENHLQFFLKSVLFEGYHFKGPGPQPAETTILKYLEFKKTRKTKKVIYTCIVGGYDQIIEPAFINKDWDYVCFTDCCFVGNYNSVWEYRSLQNEATNPSLTNRWHKIHPHLILTEYEESIYIDGNINIIGDYSYELNRYNDSDIVFPRHFKRNCVYDEIETLTKSNRFTDKQKEHFLKHREFLRSEGFPAKFGLSENNFIRRKHHSKKIISTMLLWYSMLQECGGRDQLALSFCMWRYKYDLNKCFIENCRVNYKNFRVFNHYGESGFTLKRTERIRPSFEKNCVLSVFSCNDTFVPYLGIAIESLVNHASQKYNYDIVILYFELKEKNIALLNGISESHDNVNIRFFCMKAFGSISDSKFFPVDGYVPSETYNKCFLTEIFDGYDRCLYLDSDILICADVANLFHLDMDEKPIAASRNVANINALFVGKVIKGVDFRNYLQEKLNIYDFEDYFQAGIILIDFKKLVGFDLLSESIKAIRDLGRPLFFDQCVFNKIFYKKVNFFSTSWNHVWYIQNYSYLRSSMSDDIFLDYAKGRLNPNIIHYASKDKYYNRPNWAMANRFWTFAERSAFYNPILADCKERLSELEYTDLMRTIRLKNWKKPKVLVHLHIFYPEQTQFFLDAISNLSEVDFDLFVTQSQRNPKNEALILSQFPLVKILTIRNAGYDIFPFLLVLKQKRLGEYDFLLKLHTKNSRILGQDRVYGIDVPEFAWRDRLVTSILGSRSIFLSHIDYLKKNSDVGAIAAKEFIFNTADNHEEANYALPYWRGRLRLNYSCHYVGGSMFLAKAFLFERLLDANVTEADFTSDTFCTKDSNNLAHIFERILGLVIGSDGMSIYGV